MLRLMAFNKEGYTPLYMEVIQKILREMGSENTTLDYNLFKKRINTEGLQRDQTAMLTLRLQILESYLDLKGSATTTGFGRKPSLFVPKPGTLTIVDLTSIYLDSSTACTLFDVCLGLFEQQRRGHGMVIALDEAHKVCFL